MKKSDDFINKNKLLLFIVLFVLASFAIIFSVIMPQIDELQKKQEDIKKEEKRVETLKKTLGVLAKISQEDLDRYYDLTQSGLPLEKDVLAVYTELSSAAQKNNVTLGDLTINLGEVYSKAKKADASVGTNTYGSSIVNFDVNVEGELSDMRAFSQSLYKSSPIVEILTFEAREEDGVLNANFFYNPLAITTADSDVPVEEFSSQELDLLKNLDEWKENAKADNVFIEPQGNISPTPSINITPTVKPSITITPTP